MRLAGRVAICVAITATCWILVILLLGELGIVQQLREAGGTGVEKTYRSDPGDVNTLIIDGPKRDQDVTINFTSTGPIDIYLAREKDINEALETIAAPKVFLAKSENQKKGTLTAKVPAQSAYGVAILNARNRGTEVTVKVERK
jgi:hypothetical protein